MRQLKITKQITGRESYSIEKYLQEIGKIHVLSPEEEADLAKKIRSGDRAAREKLVLSNLRFVVSVAKQYQNHGLTLGDLINEGNVGLIKAAECFDETKGFKFISYAVWWIRQSILQAIAENARLIRLPLNKISTINKVNRCYTLLEQEFQREPTEEEIAEKMDMTPEEVKENMKIATKPVSMDAPLTTDEESISLYDVYIAPDPSIQAPESSLNQDSLKTDIERSFAALSVREATILSMYYGLNGYSSMSLEEIGTKLGLTSERVSHVIGEEQSAEDWDIDELNNVLLPVVPLKRIELTEEQKKHGTKAELIEQLQEEAVKVYEAKEAEFPEPEQFREVERVILLKVIDRKWMDHIDDMDQLRQGIGLQAYGQRDPVVEYKFAGFDMFDAMIDSIAEETIKVLTHIKIEQKVEREQVAKATGTNKDESVAKAPKKRTSKKIQPNDPCPCGSGKKYKQCCGRKY